MKIIKYFCEIIECELDKAEEYAKQAIIWKDEFPEASKALFTRSQARNDDVTVLHTTVVNLINNYRAKEGKEPPEPMMSVWEYMHERHIEKAAAVKHLQDMYRNG